MSLLTILGVFFAGVVSGYLMHWAMISMQTYSGTLRIRKDGEKTVYSLELDEDLDMLAYKPLVIFKIDTNLRKDDNRE
jgi:hypothetical protein